MAAVDADGITTPFNGSESVQTYSSDGPRKIFYDTDGTAITPGDFSSTGGTTRQKPDITAADCVDTDTPGFFPFCGTSAAAPHAAAIAGLLLDVDPRLTQSEWHALSIIATAFCSVSCQQLPLRNSHGFARTPL